MIGTKREEAARFAGFIKGLGFTVYLAEAGSYGFITDYSRRRVLSFSLNDGGSLSGNYGPPSQESGTGWRMKRAPHDLKTAADVEEALYALPDVRICGKGWRYLSTVEHYLSAYGSSSKFREV